MRLEAERKQTVEQPTAARIRSFVLALRSHGPSSYASITDAHGNYLQVAGGGQTCLLEKRDIVSGRHYRAFRQERSTVFPDGTKLVFGGGEMPLQADEWMTAAIVADAFIAFRSGSPLSPTIRWRDVTANQESIV